jgi:putative phosphoesterase
MVKYLRIGLISDTHIPEARAALWPQVFDAVRGVDYILHGGDIHDLSIIDQLNALAPIYVARGNGDNGDGGRPVQPEDPRLRDAWEIELGGLRIGLTHTLPVPEIPPSHTVERSLDRLFGHRNFDVLVYGDTHVEEIETYAGVLCINPGSPTFPHNHMTQLGTIAFMEIRDGVPEASIWRLTDDGIEPYNWRDWRRTRS